MKVHKYFSFRKVSKGVGVVAFMPACAVNTHLLAMSHSTWELALMMGYLIVWYRSEFNDDHALFAHSVKKKYELE